MFCKRRAQLKLLVVKQELAEAQAVMHARGDRVDEQATEISALKEAAVTAAASAATDAAAAQQRLESTLLLHASAREQLHMLDPRLACQGSSSRSCL